MLPLDALPPPPDGPALRLLDGIRVLDLTTSVAAPFGTMMMGDLGADVVKVERRRTGDDSRAWGPPFLEGESLWYLSVNRGKSSVTLDYAAPEGREVLHRLVAAADVVVLNVVPRVQKKLGIDYRNYRILGACNPVIAREALEIEDKIGTMLPCNVVVQDVGEGSIEVAAIDPVASMAAVENAALQGPARKVADMLKSVVSTL